MKILTVLFRQFYIFDKCTTYPLYDSEYEVPMNWKNGETENGTFAKYLCYCYDRKLRCFTHVATLHYVIQTRQKGDDAGDIEN